MESTSAVEGAAYHVLQRGKKGQAVFFETSDHKVYLRMLRDNQQKHGVKILAYCLMPNHVHLIVRCESEKSLAAFFQRVHSQFGQFIKLRHGRTQGLWTSRYVCPVAASHVRKAIHYVEMNPVRSELTSHPETFEWCSANAHLGAQDTASILDLDFWRTEGGAAAWKTLLDTPEDELVTKAFRACTYARRPFGDEDFVRELADRAAAEKKLKHEAAA